MCNRFLFVWGKPPDAGSMTNGGTLQLNLESTLDSVEASELIVQQLAQRRGFSEQERSSL